MFFTRFHKQTGPFSSAALALVLAATGTVGVIALEQPAQAQRKKDKSSDEAKPDYSKEFIAAYQPANEIMQSAAPDYQAVAAMLPNILAATKNGDEKNVAGTLQFNVGLKLEDEAMQLRGLEMMRDSGKLDPARAGSVDITMYQMYRGQNNVEAARAALERAMAANYSFEATMNDGSQRTVGPEQMTPMIAELYFDQERYADGVNYLAEQIEARKAAGQSVPEAWIRSGLSNAYNNNVPSQVTKFVGWLANDYPSDTVWGDAVIVTLNANQYQNAEILDLLRLARRTGNYNDARVISEYVEVLDPRRYPGEVVAVIDHGTSLGLLKGGDSYITETRKDAAGRVAADKAELPSIAKGARSPNADLKTLVVAGDTFLSYDQPAEAEEFYTRALGMSGVETPMVLTRLGIAQYDQGKYAEAAETFKKVDGARRDVANLWAIYATQKASR